MRARQMVHHIAFYRLAVYCDGLDAFAHTIGILHGNMIFCPAEPTLHVEAFPACRDTRIDFQTFIRRLDADLIMKRRNKDELEIDRR